jgi:hypothetical protein
METSMSLMLPAVAAVLLASFVIIKIRNYLKSANSRKVENSKFIRRYHLEVKLYIIRKNKAASKLIIIKRYQSS